MQFSQIIKSFFYYFLTSGLFIAVTLLLLELISQKFNLVNFFGFTSAGFFLINLMQFNVVYNNNPSAKRGFLIHTIFGMSLWMFLAVLLIILNNYKFNILEINSIIISTMFFGYLLYFIIYYYYGYLNF
tara:strand:+ start:47 stop:433 length:387 start_codon:yes stop_codon:yes gene_type:complete